MTIRFGTVRSPNRKGWKSTLAFADIVFPVPRMLIGRKYGQGRDMVSARTIKPAAAACLPGCGHKEGEQLGRSLKAPTTRTGCPALALVETVACPLEWNQDRELVPLERNKV